MQQTASAVPLQARHSVGLPSMLRALSATLKKKVKIMTYTENRGPTPLDDDWEAEFDPTYDEKKEKGGPWYELSDEDIVLLQIEDLKNDEHEELHRRLDDIDANEDED